MSAEHEIGYKCRYISCSENIIDSRLAQTVTSYLLIVGENFQSVFYNSLPLELRAQQEG